MSDEITVHDLIALRARGDVVILDVREPHELAAAALAGVLHIPMGQIPQRLAELPRDRGIVVLCHMGARSEQVTRFLRASGFHQAVNLAGGIDAWSREIDPGVPRY